MRQIHPGNAAEFQVGDKIYRMRLSLRVLKTLEQDHNISIMRGPESILAALHDPEKFALVVYQGLRANHPEVTLDWVEDTFDATSIAMLAPVIGQAISGREAGDSPNAPTPDKPNGIGPLSGPSGDTTSASLTISSGISTLKN
jgi:hypothetical protein